MHQRRKSSLIFAITVLNSLIVIGVSGLAAADDLPDPGDADSARGDSPYRIESDTVITDTDSLSLQSIRYQPGPDTMLIAAYYERSIDSTAGTSPSMTMLKSVVVPGWGQISNGKYIKAGLIIVVESYFIYRAVDYAGLASDWRKKWKAEPDSSYLNTIYFNQYADYRDTRNSFIWYTLITAFFSMIDAYVDAHLKNFPDDIPTPDNLSIVVDAGRETRFAVSFSF